MPTTRRDWILRALGAGALPLLAAIGRAADAQQPQPAVVRIVAQRFHYTPREFRVKAGLPVVLEFTSLDFMHGFSMPDLNVRADLIPGQVTRVRLTPPAPGVYEFLCDNFCGDGHEQMNGRMVAEA
ncbi:MAG: cupredoxin domain-containing protein [Ramlibacter sp.]